jgi:hypothetical protein
MGTNYYLITNYCECCGRKDKLHIGKNSSGWKFTFELPQEYSKVMDFMKDIMLKTMFEDAFIEDEYGQPVTYEMLCELLKKNGDVGNKRVDEDGYVYERYEFC